MFNLSDVSESIVNYEMHIVDLTVECQYIPEHERGKFLGACNSFIIEHLKSLNVNCVQLMPIFDSYETHWGYDVSSWFDLNEKYGTLSDFKYMLKTFQDSGIKVILDVVYNHVATEYIDSFKSKGVKFFENWNVTGCGHNCTVDVKSSLPIIMKSIKYWMCEIGIDGMRFDLESVLGREELYGSFNKNADFFKEMEQFTDKILISESYDCEGYNLGEYPKNWIELHDHARDVIRNGNSLYLGDMYEKSMGYITCHDGFTIFDLVSYNFKHNEKNGENNRDGCSNNYSYNHGIEGFTDNDIIINDRENTILKMIKNLETSCKHIMLSSGDEFRLTKNGNNNSYLNSIPLIYPKDMLN